MAEAVAERRQALRAVAQQLREAGFFLPGKTRGGGVGPRAGGVGLGFGVGKAPETLFGEMPHFLTGPILLGGWLGWDLPGRGGF